MEIAIGSKIKQLRGRYNCTQENMAQKLGVTSQAISRWENGTGYPDVEIIPVIANYFGVTIDFLFGYDGTRNDRIRQILSRAAELERNKTEPSVCVEELRLAAAEFPASDAITMCLANALMRCGWKYYGAVSVSGEDDSIGGSGRFNHPDYEYNRGNRYWQEALLLYESLLDSTNDEDIREEAVERVLMLYWEFGRTEDIAALAAKASRMHTSSEMILSWNDTPDKHGAALIAALEVFRELLEHNAGRPFLSEDRRTKEIELLISLYRFVYDDGRFGEHHREMVDLYARLTSLRWNMGEKEKAFEALAEAKKHHDAYYSLLRAGGEYHYSSTYTGGTVSSVDEWESKYGRSDGISTQFSETAWIYSDWNPGLWEDPRFQEIVGETDRKQDTAAIVE